eukprot:scaffold94_cov340-Prasinococcus_capsulatus_cf.AAC.13
MGACMSQLDPDAKGPDMLDAAPARPVHAHVLVDGPHSAQESTPRIDHKRTREGSAPFECVVAQAPAPPAHTQGTTGADLPRASVSAEANAPAVPIPSPLCGEGARAEKWPDANGVGPSGCFNMEASFAADLQPPALPSRDRGTAVHSSEGTAIRWKQGMRVRCMGRHVTLRLLGRAGAHS